MYDLIMNTTFNGKMRYELLSRALSSYIMSNENNIMSIQLCQYGVHIRIYLEIVNIYHDVIPKKKKYNLILIKIPKYIKWLYIEFAYQQNTVSAD